MYGLSAGANESGRSKIWRGVAITGGSTAILMQSQDPQYMVHAYFIDISRKILQL